jgi:hypothetical protein
MDHRVGTAAGCRYCGRFREACARRPCSGSLHEAARTTARLVRLSQVARRLAVRPRSGQGRPVNGFDRPRRTRPACTPGCWAARAISPRPCRGRRAAGDLPAAGRHGQGEPGVHRRGRHLSRPRGDRPVHRPGRRTAHHPHRRPNRADDPVRSAGGVRRPRPDGARPCPRAARRPRRGRGRGGPARPGRGAGRPGAEGRHRPRRTGGVILGAVLHLLDPGPPGRPPRGTPG